MTDAHSKNMGLWSWFILVQTCYINFRTQMVLQFLSVVNVEITINFRKNCSNSNLRKQAGPK